MDLQLANEWIRPKEKLPLYSTYVLMLLLDEDEIREGEPIPFEMRLGYFDPCLGWKTLYGGDYMIVRSPVIGWQPPPRILANTEEPKKANERQS